MPKTQRHALAGQRGGDRLRAGHLALNARPLDEPAELDMIGPGRGRVATPTRPPRLPPRRCGQDLTTVELR